jgi:hypothetical protein
MSDSVEPTTGGEHPKSPKKTLASLSTFAELKALILDSTPEQFQQMLEAMLPPITPKKALLFGNPTKDTAIMKQWLASKPTPSEFDAIVWHPMSKIEYPAAANEWPADIPTWNCRCTTMIIEVPWLLDLRRLLDEHVGNTDPRTEEFR